MEEGGVELRQVRVREHGLLDEILGECPVVLEHD